jgi:hypothetical protein
VVAGAVDHRRAHGARQRVESVTDRENEAIVEGVALGCAVQAQHGDLVVVPADVELEG